MDVQQLSGPGSGGWSLRTAADPHGAGLLAGTVPWWHGGSRTVPQDRPRARHLAAEGSPVPVRPAGPGRVLLLVSGGLTAAACVVAALALLAGFRWFVVETPSMGTAAPVGTLVITTPPPTLLQPGTIIAFTPPGPPRTYTHRVFSVAADGGIRTKGDINPTPDAWTIRPSAVLGAAVAVLPGFGYVLRGLPAMIAGGALLWLLTALISRRDRRASARVTGLHLVATLVILWMQPFVRIVLIATEASTSGTRASIVSTGLLPVRLTDTAGAVLARLTIGRPEVVALPHTGEKGLDRIFAYADLGAPMQLLLIAIAVVPSLVVLLVGIPRGPEHRA